VRAFRVSLISALLLGAVCVLQEPVRRSTLAFLRFPFALIKGALSLIIVLPRLPSLTADNERLRADVIQARTEAASLREDLRQVRQSHALLEAAPLHAVAASVLSRSTIPTQHTVLLDKGQRHGLTLESAVIDADGVIGRITELHPWTCLVTLVTDADSRIAGLVERSRESGLLIGRGHGRCEFIYLDIDADIEVEDRILTAGFGGPLPKGLRLGTVTRVDRDEASGTTRAIVRPAAHVGQLEDVLCLPPAS
jgi:rod shape-determining protein MreC